MSDTALIVFLLILGFGQLVLAIRLLKPKPKEVDPQKLGVLRRAYAKAKAILTQAELSGIKIQAESRVEQEKYVSKLEKRMTAACDQAVDEYKKLLPGLLETERTETKKALATYLAIREKDLDEKFTAAAERALEIILQKKITLTDETELVYQALEQAKKEKLIT